ncbi:MAG: deoxyribose-phosphate aldolase [Candidatus Marinimicrobia bacterium]|nr:deoxyribose-phosphate aldolase [Candidatus Neomarinimicrobiota bacterium]MCF7830121.1 deoxyribose-phosphate aldolase [Candidatus Neomarinimicrobiota bacterium]MCF7882490.1 deoxyribose-phosphate aldolase [Candidatus Neomarinimicrobiota bacterium]
MEEFTNIQYETDRILSEFSGDDENKFWLDGIDTSGSTELSSLEKLAQSTPTNFQPAALAGIIDHTILKPEATPEQVRQICEEAKEYKFASVCVNPSFVDLCVKALGGSKIPVASVVGFPLGANTGHLKAGEAREAATDGASELDMVINIGHLKAGDYAYVQDDIAAVVEAAPNCIVKVILETCLLTDEEKAIASLLAKEVGADYVKTSTGFSSGGATVHDVALMRYTVGTDMGVKASGGIRTAEDAIQMVRAGASRIGASSGVQIISKE